MLRPWLLFASETARLSETSGDNLTLSFESQIGDEDWVESVPQRAPGFDPVLVIEV